MDRAKVKNSKPSLFQNLITYLLNYFQYSIVHVECSYETVWKIINERLDNELHMSLDAIAYYLNPCFQYEANFRQDNSEVKEGLYICMRRLVG